jgi:hypothetical protein
MSKPFFLVMIGLVALLGSDGRCSSGQELAKAEKKPSDRSEWWGRDHLKAMKEPSLRELAERDRTVTVFRFLWLPSFHNPISVRFVKSDEGAVVHAVRLDGKGGYEPGQIQSSKSAKLSRAHWERITGHLVKSKFWTLPTEKATLRQRRHGRRYVDR